MSSSHASLAKAKESFEKQHYDLATKYYERLCEQESATKSHFAYLGLCHLLQHNEDAAHLVWSFAITSSDDMDVAQWIITLGTILDQEADALLTQDLTHHAWLIRRHLLEIDCSHISNLLKFTKLSITHQEQYLDSLLKTNIIERISIAEDIKNIDVALISRTLESLFDHIPQYTFTLDFTTAIVKRLVGGKFNFSWLIDLLIKKSKHIGQIRRNKALACEFLVLALDLDDQNLEILRSLSAFKRANHQYEEAINYAYKYCDLCKTNLEKAKGNAEIIAAFMSAGGHWVESRELLNQQEELLKKLLIDDNSDTRLETELFAKSCFFYPYLADEPLKVRNFQNSIAHAIQDQLVNYVSSQTQDHCGKDIIFPHSSKKKVEKIKIGYISRCLHQHSVGWLSRWLFYYHDREKFEIHTYFVQQSNISDFSKKWFAQKSTRASCFTGDYLGISESIYEDGIDILVDLDSLTCDCTCNVMALKPAPIQVSWLGLDASGLPAIDYFLVDPYVLPENAQDYYSEKLWRLPQTYIAVDGFEVGIPSLKRKDLDIPDHAVVYFSVQSGFKRHPEFTRLQLEIIRQVPNSYFLIKGIGDEKQIKGMFEELAHDIGIELNRLRFIPRDIDELTHRANLSIADVVLDTFPYNGATTTLETLWMNIPLVTRVGEQFAARNSYTMMVNAGLQEGIAWNNQEYVEWGVKLGHDQELRSQISSKLRKARHTALLWNAKAFTREVEQAYQQMWEAFVSAS